MRKNQFTGLAERVRKCDPSAVLRAADRFDGQSVFNAKAFLEDGLPQEVVDYVSRTHGSDGTPKGTIFADGKPVPVLCGVYGLDLLQFLAAALDVDYPSAFGRGFQARHIQVAIHQHFQNQPDKLADKTPSEPLTRGPWEQFGGV